MNITLWLFTLSKWTAAHLPRVWLVLVLFITADTKQFSPGGLQLLSPLLAS